MVVSLALYVSHFIFILPHSQSNLLPPISFYATVWLVLITNKFHGNNRGNVEIYSINDNKQCSKYFELEIGEFSIIATAKILIDVFDPEICINFCKTRFVSFCQTKLKVVVQATAARYCRSPLLCYFFIFVCISSLAYSLGQKHIFLFIVEYLFNCNWIQCIRSKKDLTPIVGL